MKIRFTLFFLLIFLNNLFSQINATIIDEKTNEKVPFVNIWVENENIGTSADANRKFTLEKIKSDKILVFSAIGYENLKINSNEIKEVVKLVPTITNLKEVVLIQRKNNKKLVIEKYKKSIINHYWACNFPKIEARLFNYKQEYSNTPFLRTIKVLTNNEKKEDAVFNVRLYNIGKNGLPESTIYDENILGYAKNGKKNTEIDVSNLNIQFPEKGIIIAVEWIITDANKSEYEIFDQITKSKKNHIHYNPNFGTIPVNTNDNLFFYYTGKWYKNTHKSSTDYGLYKDKYLCIAMELTLTN